MRCTAIVLLAFLTISITASAQKAGLINSGEVIKEGIKLYDSSEYKKALLLFDKVNRSDTNYVWAMYQKAVTCEADSQYMQAIKYCKEGLALKEQREYEPDLYNTYGNTLSDLKQYDESLKVFDAAISKYPHYSLFHFNKGVVMLQQERPHDAELAFQKALLINPYMYSAHYQLSLSALQQGKLIPAFMSSVAYLFVNPEGKYFSNAINILSQISKSTDEVLKLKNGRKETPDANYQMMEEIILSKIALDKQYKPIISLDDVLSRQMQVLFEKLEYDAGSKDFYIQYYLPYYKQVYQNGKFEPFVYHAFSNAKVDLIQDYLKKNKKLMEGFVNEAADYFNNIRATQQLACNKRDTVTRRYAYDSGRLVGRGSLINNGKTLTGPWEFYYPAGNLKGAGVYNPAGNREGEWSFYTYTGSLRSKEHYVNGKLQGKQDYYYDNGNPSSHEIEANDQLDGPAATFYYGGAKKLEVGYKLGKKSGTEKMYYDNGNLKAVNNYIDGVLTGPAKEYYKSGALKASGQYVNGKTEGLYNSYNESGRISTEMNFVKEEVNGDWKSYYDNGKLKEKRSYIANQEDGLHQEYYENGQLATNYTVKKGKLNGEANFYNKDGKVYSKYLYDNGVVKSVKYFDPAGKQIFASELKGNLIDIISFNAQGVKKEHFAYDNKGEVTGPDTVFFQSGKVSQTSMYVNGKVNGPVVSYYLNGQKKSEINMTDGENDGYYTSFYVNGQPQTEGWIQNGEYQGEWLNYDIRGKLSSRSYYLDSELNGYKEDLDPTGKKTTEEKYYKGLLVQMTQYDNAGKVIAKDEFPKGLGKYTLRYPDGKVMAQTNLVNGTFTGPYKSYYFDGSVESSMYYANGLLDSTYTSYFYGGIKHTEGAYHKGNKTGKWKLYYEDGTLSRVSTYVNDVLEGERIDYDTDGTKDFVSTFKDDALEGLSQKYDPDGTLAYQMNFENGDLSSYSYMGKDGKPMPFITIDNNNSAFRSYFANGKLSRECTYIDGLKHGKMTLYYTNGQIRAVDNTVYGVNEGLSQDFYPDGKLKNEYTYVADNVDGAGKEYYKNGKLKTETIYLNGSMHGPAKYYDENGKLTKTLLYNYGVLMSVKNEK